MDGLLGLRSESGGRHAKYNGATMEYSLSNLAASIANTPLAPSGSGSTQMFRAEATIRLEVLLASSHYRPWRLS